MSMTISTFPDTSGLWKTYCTERCQCHRHEIIETYLPMVRRIAGKMYRKLPTHADLEDVVSYGNFGLIHAVDVYEPGRCGACGHMHYLRPGVAIHEIDPGLAAARGLMSGVCRSPNCTCGTPKEPEAKVSPPRYRFVKFETVAAAHIRGRILDEFRSIDWAPRSVRRQQREIDDAVEHLEAQLHREPTPTEIAARITKVAADKAKKAKPGAKVEPVTVTAAEVAFRLHETDAARVGSLDEPVTEDGQGLEVEDHRVAQMFSDRSLSQVAAGVFTELSASKRLMLALRYYELMPIEQIALVLRVEPERANQLHAEAVLAFRDVLAIRLTHA